jgi:GH25 family lysozyme M1 (1,4-beta-N-acetylmuramidase)
MTIYYTITGKCDGFGAQYQSILSGIALCKAENYIYVHTPMKTIEHGVDVNKANEFIGIKQKKTKKINF